MLNIILNGDYYIKPITDEQHHEIKKLYDSCSDYHLMCSEKMATDEDVNQLFIYTEQKTKQDSLTLGIYNKDTILIGIIDVFKNDPTINTWMIGLLLLTPDERNKKLGTILHEELKQYAQAHQVEKLRIGVLEQNQKGLNFWVALGYQQVQSTTIRLGDKLNDLNILELIINEPRGIKIEMEHEKERKCYE